MILCIHTMQAIAVAPVSEPDHSYTAHTEDKVNGMPHSDHRDLIPRTITGAAMSEQAHNGRSDRGRNTLSLDDESEPREPTRKRRHSSCGGSRFHSKRCCRETRHESESSFPSTSAAENTAAWKRRSGAFHRTTTSAVTVGSFHMSGQSTSCINWSVGVGVTPHWNSNGGRSHGQHQGGMENLDNTPSSSHRHSHGGSGDCGHSEHETTGGISSFPMHVLQSLQVNAKGCEKTAICLSLPVSLD